MTQQHPIHRLLVVTLVAVMALAPAACGKRVDPAPDDAAISARVRTALLNDPGIAALDVAVESTGHVVTLSGTVRTAAERDRAIAIARNTSGVAQVRSELQVEP